MADWLGVDMAQRTCEIPECGRTHLARGWCKRHYRRWTIYGDPLGKAPSKFVPRECAVPGCGAPLEPMRNGRGMCFSHLTRTLRHGSPERQCESCGSRLRDARRFCSVECRPDCLLCGGRPADDAPKGYPALCSWRCLTVYRNYGVDVPRSAECADCGDRFNLFEKAPSGRWRKLTRIYCATCAVKTRWHRARITAADLAARDGYDCKLCGLPVDLAIKRSSDGLMCASIDHIVPRSLGGSDDPTNLQLAHLLCNMRKGNRAAA